MPDEADATRILTAFPPDDRRKPPGRARVTWFKTRRGSARTEIREPLPERSNRYGSEPTSLQRLLSTFCAMHSYTGACQKRRRRPLPHV